MTTTFKIGGAVYDNDANFRITAVKTKVEELMAVFGYRATEYDFTINVTPQRIPQEQFHAGDVYSYKYSTYGQEYTFVFDGTDWTGKDMTSGKMREAIRSGHAYKCKLIKA